MEDADCIGYAHILKIVFKERCIEKLLSDDDHTSYTFEKIMSIAKEGGFDGEDTIIVIAESPMAGKVFKYGNYGPYWVEVGTTEGYA